MQLQKIKRVQRRQAATCNGLRIRVRDLGFDKVCDPRVAGKVDYALPTLLTALVAAMVTMARSLRMVEQRTEQMACKQGSWMNVEGRIADKMVALGLDYFAQLKSPHGEIHAEAEGVLCRWRKARAHAWRGS